eukprot:1270474-Ditylum_brightwellii.AAC.1
MPASGCERTKHKRITPSQLCASRPEYQAFQLKVFTQRISQEVCRQKFVNYLEWKRVEKCRAFNEKAAKKGKNKRRKSLLV